MGRTNPTFRDVLNRFETDWQPYRRALRREYQEDFDRVMEGARRFADAAGKQNAVHPQDAIMFSMILSVAVQQRELEERIEALEQDERE